MFNRVAILIVALLLLSGFSARSQIIDTVCVSQSGTKYEVPFTSGSTYTWILGGGGAISSGQGTNKIAINWSTTAGVYTLKVFATNASGCNSDTSIAQIAVINKMPVMITGPSSVCFGDTAIFTGTGADSIFWSSGFSGKTWKFSDTVDTQFYIVGKTGRCYSDTVRSSVLIKEKAFANFNFEPDYWVVEEKITLSFTGARASKLTWYIDGTLVESGKKDIVLYYPPDTGTLVFSLLAENFSGCHDSISYIGYVFEKSRVFVPTAFTPNGDGLNDSFGIKYYGFSEAFVRIYNRWNIPILETNDINFRWDGTYQGNIAPPGIYFYQIVIKDPSGYEEKVNGEFTLLR